MTERPSPIRAEKATDSGPTMSPPVDFTIYEIESWQDLKWMQSYVGDDHEPNAEAILSELAIAHSTTSEDQ